MRTLSIALLSRLVTPLLSRVAPYVRRDKIPFPELAALRRGIAPKRASFLDRWFPPRTFLLQSAQRTVAMGFTTRLQLAVVAACLVTLIGFTITMISTALDHHASNKLARELDQLRRSAHVETARATADRELLGRLGRELAMSSAERDRAAAEASHDDRTLVAQKAEIDRLTAERDRAVAERNKVVAERNAHLAVLVQLDAQTQTTIAEVEGIISSTGLDPARMVKMSGDDRNAPRGGPFVPWKSQSLRVDTAELRQVDAAAAGLDRLQSLRDILEHVPLASPTPQIIMSNGFGYRVDPFSGFGAMHEGIDLRTSGDGAVYATAAGAVRFAGWKGEYGNLIEIDHGFGLMTRYAHLSKIYVKPGDPVTLNQQLGQIGATGRATGVHLHYEVRVDGRPRNPVNFLKADRHVPETDRYVPEATHAVSSQIPATDEPISVDHR